MSKILFFSLLFANFTFGQDEMPVYYDYSFEFEKGTTQYLFGDNVVFRSEPSSSSKALDTLTIASEIKILAKMDETMEFRGKSWHWYKVKYNKQTGYILGGLIAVLSAEIDNERYLVSIEVGEDVDFAEYRLLREDETFESGQTPLRTGSFTISVHGNRGVDGIKNMLIIDLMAESCGVDGGETYIFNTGEQLIDAINLASVADGDSFWFTERIFFPDDKEGDKGYIIYERTQGGSKSAETIWHRSVTDSVYLTWESDHFSPNLADLDFSGEE